MKQNDLQVDSKSQQDSFDSNSSSSTDSGSSGFNASDFIDDVENVTETLVELIDEQLMYRVLASTGLAISEFTHEIQMCLTNLNLNSQELVSLADLEPRIALTSAKLEENLGLLNAYTDFFDWDPGQDKQGRMGSYWMRHHFRCIKWPQEDQPDR